MIAEVPLFPDQASTHAGRVDSLFFFIVAITAAVSLLVTVLIITFAVRYRRRPNNNYDPHIQGSMKLELFWTITPFFFFMAMFVWGARVYFAVAESPKDAMEVYVVGKQWMWKMQHQTGQREINELHVPVDQAVKLTLTSEDVIDDFFVPDFRIKLDVLPGRYMHTWFQATKVGTYDLYCSQYCGTNHAGMIGKVVVMEKSQFDGWLSSQAEGSLALQGRKLFLKYQCITCHSADSQARAPVLEGLFGRMVALEDGKTVVANEDYIRESIYKPRAKIVFGWRPIMPSFEGQIDEQEMIELIAFIKALRPGETPVRNEESTPPAVDPTSEEASRPKP